MGAMCGLVTNARTTVSKRDVNAPSLQGAPKPTYLEVALTLAPHHSPKPKTHKPILASDVKISKQAG